MRRRRSPYPARGPGLLPRPATARRPPAAPRSTAIETAWGFQLTEQGQPLERCELGRLEPAADEVVVETAGCGVCHTDVAFAYEGVPTRHPLPLVLGHEIAGRVVATGAAAADWMGRAVLVQAVIACGSCAACERRRPTVCARQYMPGNDGPGGFATHVRVPARGLCPVPEPLPAGIALDALAVVADAVTTPYEAIRRAELDADDVAVFVGVGGVGGFGVQIAAALGAAVVAIDVDATRLELAAAHGAELVLDAASESFRGLKSAVRDFVSSSGRSGVGLKVFETSGTAAGQQTAWGLLGAGGYLAVVGFTPQKVELRLSNLMAFDATARGNWGCSPERYPEALALAIEKRIVLEPFIERQPLAAAPAVLAGVHEGAFRRRPVLVAGSTERSDR